MPDQDLDRLLQGLVSRLKAVEDRLGALELLQTADQSLSQEDAVHFDSLNVGPDAAGASSGQVYSAGTNDPFWGQRRTDTVAAAATLLLARARDNAGALEVVQNGDYLMRLLGYGWDGDSWAEGADIIALINGTPGNGDMPTELQLRTSPDGSASPTARLRVLPDGRLLAPSIYNNTLPSGTDQYIANGTYTPTLYNTTNVDASSATLFNWLRLGRMVVVQGVVLINPNTAAPTATVLGIDVPIPSSMANLETLSGVGTQGDTNQVAEVRGDAANDRAIVRWNATDPTNQIWSIMFMYRVD